MKRIEERIWILLTAVCTFVAGFCAAMDHWSLFRWTLAVWLFLGFVLAVCKPGDKSGARNDQRP